MGNGYKSWTNVVQTKNGDRTLWGSRLGRRISVGVGLFIRDGISLLRAWARRGWDESLNRGCLRDGAATLAVVCKCLRNKTIKLLKSDKKSYKHIVSHNYTSWWQCEYAEGIIFCQPFGTLKSEWKEKRQQGAVERVKEFKEFKGRGGRQPSSVCLKKGSAVQWWFSSRPRNDTLNGRVSFPVLE